MFTPTSTTAFMTFVCDEEAVTGESYLRADYNVSCNTAKHMWYQVYALAMIAVRINCCNILLCYVHRRE